MKVMDGDMQNKNSVRQSNIELLRIIAMVMIVGHHFAVHGWEGGFPYPSISVNRLWIQFIQMGGKIGVNVFVLISGYFLIVAPKIKISKVIKFWLQIAFYSFIIFALFVGTGLKSFSVIELVKHIFPVIMNQWWFASTYFVLYLLSPYINILLKNLNRRQYIIFLVLLGGCWCVIPTFTAQNFQSNSLAWFVYLYAIAGYIKLFGLKKNVTSKKWILLAIFFAFLTYVSVVTFDLLGMKVVFFGKNATFFYNMQSFPMLVISVSLFLGFRALNIGCNKFVNTISAATFGVYLIHEEPYVRDFLWSRVVKTTSYTTSKILILYSLVVIMLVFVVCTMIELLRIHVIEKHYMPGVMRLAQSLENRVKSWKFELK